MQAGCRGSQVWRALCRRSTRRRLLACCLNFCRVEHADHMGLLGQAYRTLARKKQSSGRVGRTRDISGSTGAGDCCMFAIRSGGGVGGWRVEGAPKRLSGSVQRLRQHVSTTPRRAQAHRPRLAKCCTDGRRAVSGCVDVQVARGVAWRPQCRTPRHSSGFINDAAGKCRLKATGGAWPCHGVGVQASIRQGTTMERGRRTPAASQRGSETKPAMAGQDGRRARSTLEQRCRGRGKWGQTLLEPLCAIYPLALLGGERPGSGHPGSTRALRISPSLSLPRSRSRSRSRALRPSPSPPLVAQAGTDNVAQ